MSRALSHPVCGRFANSPNIYVKRSIAILFLLFLVGISSPLISFSSAHDTENATKGSSAQASPPPQRSCCGQAEGDNKPHLLAASYYSFKDNLSTKLLLNNKGPLPLEARPTLFSLNGERLDIAPVTVEANSFRMIEMREWVASAGPQFQKGSIQVFHLGRDLVLGAQIYLEDEARSLSFEEKLVEPSTFKSSKLGGLWWLPSRKGTVRLAVSNTSDLQLSVTASVNGERPKKSAQVTFELSRHETRLLDVQGDLIGQSDGAMSRFGRIAIEHTGPSGTVQARAMAQDSSTGYALAIQFSDPAAAKSSKLQGAGLRLGSAGGERLSPMVVARNNGATQSVITGRIPYTAQDGSMGTITLPVIHLEPGEMSALDLSGQARNVSQRATSAGLEFEYSTPPGSVAIAAFSVGDGGNQLFRVPLWDIYAQRSSTGGYPWRIEGDSSTAVYIKNTAEHQQHYFLQLNYPGGVYAVGTKNIEGGQTATYDVRKLRDEQVPDAQGSLIPIDATGGQIHWSKVGPESGVLIGRSEQADIKQGVSSNYACQNCCNDNPGQPSITPDNTEGVVGGTYQFIARQNLEDCYGGYYNSEDVIAQWTSSDDAIATVAAGTASAQGAGTVTITAQWTTSRYTFEHPQEGNFGSLGECVAYGTNFSASATFRVKPVISGPTNVWWFNGQTPAGYATQITLSTSCSGTSWQWAVTANANKVTLGSNGSCSITVQGAVASGNQNDISITSTVNGVASAPYHITVRAPKSLTFVADGHAPNNNYGYTTLIEYQIRDQTGTLLPSNVPINEIFTTSVINDYPGTNWIRNTNFGALVSPSGWSDEIDGQPLSGAVPQPTAPCSPLCTTLVHHFDGEWWVGSTTPGVGVKVQTNTWNRYTDHASHSNRVSPPQ